MSVYDIRPEDIGVSTQTIQSTQSVGEASTMINQVDMGIRVIGLIQVICSLLIIVGLIVGVIYMIKSKKTAWKKILIGAVIIVVPVVLFWILNIVKANMLLNM